MLNFPKKARAACSDVYSIIILIGFIINHIAKLPENKLRVSVKTDFSLLFIIYHTLFFTTIMAEY